MKKLLIFAAGSILLASLGSPAQAFTYNQSDTAELDTQFLGSNAPRIGLSRFTGGADIGFSALDALRGRYATVETTATPSSAAAFTEEFLPQQAFVYNELNDAGELLATGQTIGFTEIQTPGAGLTINGTLAPLPDSSGTIQLPDADLYAISLVGGVPLTATVTNSTNGGEVDDTSLFLFNSAGIGVAYNEEIANQAVFVDPPGTNFLSSITYTPPTSDTYYLAIAYGGSSTVDNPTLGSAVYQPQDAAGNLIWYDSADDYFASRGGVIGFTDTTPSSTQPLASWNDFGTQDTTFSYTLAVIPEPSIGGGLLALGSLSLAALGRKKKAPGVTK